MPHILEMDIQRGISLWLDGQKPDNRWSYGGIEDDILRSNDLIVKGLNISQISLAGVSEGVPKVGAPVELIIDGKIVNGEIVAWASGPQSEGLPESEVPTPTTPIQIAATLDDVDEFEDFDGETSVTLVNGETISVGDTHLYVKIAF